ncbi:MAG TPA: hypothetical protein DD490_28800 [Acidobacteria bacterium]|nr:hypothetical protein [Acidobacteriota bacterium]
MKHSSWGVGLVLFLLLAAAGQGQPRVVTPDLSTINDGASWTLHDATAEAVEVDGRKAVRLRSKGDSADGIIGIAVFNGFELTTGTIEIELKGKNVRQESFVGVAFNVAGAKTFEAVYFRPFNFRAEGVFKGRAVQYVSWPANTWEKLRESQPGVFEAPVQPVPDPDGWFRARIEIGEKQVRVFVESAAEPSLTVERLAEGGKGRPVGLFVDVSDGLYAHFKVSADS